MTRKNIMTQASLAKCKNVIKHFSVKGSLTTDERLVISMIMVTESDVCKSFFTCISFSIRYYDFDFEYLALFN